MTTEKSKKSSTKKASSPKQPKTEVSGAAGSTERENVKKWGKTLIAAGWTCVPNTIILRQQALGLEPLDLNILLVIAAHWWKAEQLAFPSKQLIADTIGVNPSTVRRRIAAMERDGLLARIIRPQAGQRHKSNQYRFDGLIKGAEPFAREDIEVRRANREYRETRAAKKGVAPGAKR